MHMDTIRIRGDGNIFTTEHGGMSFYDEDGNPGNEIYFTGVIDVLQKYNKRKQMENWVLSMRVPDVSTVSCVPPDQYSQRMVEFLKDKIM